MPQGDRQHQATSRSEGAASFRVVSAVVTSSCEDSETEEGSTPLQPHATLEPEPGPITLHEEGSGHQHPHAAVLQPRPGPAAQLPPSEGNTASPALEVPMAIAPLPPTAPQPPPPEATRGTASHSAVSSVTYTAHPRHAAAAAGHSGSGSNGGVSEARSSAFSRPGAVTVTDQGGCRSDARRPASLLCC